MQKSDVIQWVKYAGRVIDWIAGAVETFPEKGKETSKPKANQSEPNGK